MATRPYVPGALNGASTAATWAVSLCCVISVGGCADWPWEAEPPRNLAGVELVQYPNGLRVLTQHADRMTTAVRLTVNSGYSSDPTGKEGLAHLVEHLVSSSREGPGPEWIDSIRSLGAVSENASTNPDETAYEAIVPSARVWEALRLTHRLLDEPLASVDEALFRRERQLVKSERWLRDDLDIPAPVWAELGKLWFREEHPYRHAELGTEASVDAIEWGDVERFVAEHYRADNASVVVVGPISPSARDELQRFSTIEPAKSTPGNRKGVSRDRLLDTSGDSRWSEEMPPGPQLTRLEAGSDKSRLWFGWTLPPDPSRLERNATTIAHVAGVRLNHPFSDEVNPSVSNARLSGVAGKHAVMLLGSLDVAEGYSAEGALEWATVQVRRALFDQLQLRKGNQYYALDPIGSAMGVARADWIAGLENPLSRAQLFSYLTQRGLDPRTTHGQFNDLWREDSDSIREYVKAWLTRQRVRAVHAVKSAQLGPHLRPMAGHGRSDDATQTHAHVVSPAAIERISATLPTAKLRSGRLPSGLSYAFLDWKGVQAPVVFIGHDRGVADAPTPAIGRATELALGRHTWLEVGERAISHHRAWGADSSYAVAWSPTHDLASLAEFMLRREREELPSWPGIAGDSPERPSTMREPYATSFAALLRDHPWAESAVVDEVSSVTSEQVQQHWQDAFGPHHSILIAVGELDANTQERLLTTASDWTLAATSTASDERVTVAPLMWTPIHELRFEQLDTVTQHAEFRCLLPSGSSRVTQRLTSKVTERVLSRALRRERAIAYTVGSEISTFRGDPAVLTIRADMPLHRAVEAFEVWQRFDSRPAAEILTPDLDEARFDVAREMNAYGLTPFNIGYLLLSTWIADEDSSQLASFASEIARTPKGAVVDAFTFCREHSVLTFYGDRERLKSSWSQMLLGLATADTTIVAGPGVRSIAPASDGAPSTEKTDSPTAAP